MNEKLVNWTSSASVQSLLTVLLSTVVSTLAVADPGVHLPTWVRGTIPAVSVLVAWIAHRYIVRSATQKAVATLLEGME